MDTFAVLSLQKRNNLELTSYELNRKNRSPAILFPESSNCLVTNKCSAVAEMGDYLATVDIGPKVGAAVHLSLGQLDPHLTQCRLGRGLPSYQVAS